MLSFPYTFCSQIASPVPRLRVSRTAGGHAAMPEFLVISRHPKHWHLRVYWHSSFGLAKASKVRAATWHMIWNSWREMMGPIFYNQVMKTIFCAQKDHGQAGQQPPCYWHILDVKIDLAPNLHSVAKSAGSWVQEKIERDTAALNLHSFSSTDGMPLVHWSNIITSVHRRPRNQNVSGLKWP